MTVNNEVQIAPRENVVIEDYVTFSRGSQIVASQVVVTKNISEDYVVVAGVSV